MAKALGMSPESEPAKGTARLSQYLKGSVGLIFSPRDPAAMQAYTDNFRPQDYARSGSQATRTFILPAGILHSRGGDIDESEDVPLLASQEPGLRALGVPTKLLRGKVVLDDPHTVCQEGETLNSNQTTLLKTFGVATAEFRLELRAVWSAQEGTVTTLGGERALGNGGMDVDDASEDDGEELEE